MPDHRLDPTRESLHGDFRRDRPPALTVDPGETVRFSTLDVSWGLENHLDEVSPRPKWGPRDAEGDDGPALTGPVARGDVGTVAEHLRQLEPLSPDIRPTYVALARATAERALASGRLWPTAAEPLLDILADDQER